MRRLMMIMMILLSDLVLAKGTDNITKWGLGIIRPVGVIQGAMLNFPPEWIQCYDGDRGYFAKLRPRLLEGYAGSFELFIPKQDTILDLDGNLGEIEVTYEGSCLTYSGSDDKYARILSALPGYEVWISLSQLGNLGYRLQPWREFMAEQSTFYYPLFNQTAPLRVSPSDTSEVILEVTDANDKEFEVVLTENWQGNWAYATVELLTEIYGRDRKVLGRWQGWIKVVDEKGYPLIWYYSRGC